MAVLALRRREDARLRIGLALGAGSAGVLSLLAMLVRSLSIGNTFG